MQYISIGFSSFPGEGDVWFSLNGKTYQNNSCVAMEDIGENDTALLCMTNFTDCCTSIFTMTGSASGDWFFPNGTRIVNGTTIPSEQEDIYVTRDHMVVCMHRRKGGVAGIYHCEIPDSMNVMQTIYIGVHTANTSTGE